MMLKRPFRFASRLGDGEYTRGFKSLVEDFEEKIAFICIESDIEPEEVTEYAEIEGFMNRRGRREYRTMLRLIRQYPKWASSEAVQAGLLLAPSLKYIGSRYKIMYEDMLQEYGIMYEGLIQQYEAAYASSYLSQINTFSEGAKSMLHVAAMRLAECVALREDTSQWTKLIARSLAAGLDVHLEQQLGYWLPCLIYKPWATPLGLYVLSLSIQHVPWEHHWTIRENLSEIDKFRILFSDLGTPSCPQIPPLASEVHQKIDEGLQFWARLLQGLGADLQKYGEVESRAFTEAELQCGFDFEQVSRADSWLC